LAGAILAGAVLAISGVSGVSKPKSSFNHLNIIFPPVIYLLNMFA
jgi:hypothetical protein